MVYATVEDMTRLWRSMTTAEMQRAEALIPVVSDALRLEAEAVGRNLDEMAQRPSYCNVLKSVIVDIVARVLMTSTDSEPATQFSQSALGYSVSGTFLSPGGGMFIKESELKRLGLRRQQYGVIEMFGEQYD